MSDVPFKIHAELEAFEKADDPDGHTMRIGGICTTDKLDKQEERVLQDGLDFSPFLAEGWYNDNHGQRTIDVVGYPTDAKYVNKGDPLPTGRRADRSGWWTEGYLVNTEEGRRLFGLAQSLSKSPRKLGFSIEGKVIERHKRNRNVVTRAMVRNVAVTHCPVNTDTEMHVLAKALTAGAAIDSADLNQGPGDGGALRTESLEGSPSDQGGKRKRKKDDDEELATELLEAGEDGGTEDDVSKADDVPEVDFLDVAGEWGPAVQKQIAQEPPPGRLTKAEAAIVVRDRFPHLSDAQVDRIIRHAGGSA